MFRLTKDIIKGIIFLIWSIITLFISVLIAGLSVLFYWFVSFVLVLIALPSAVYKTIKQLKEKENT